MAKSTVDMVCTHDGTNLAVESIGTGPVILMLPGLGYGSWSWCRQIPELATDHRVIAVNNRGTGNSDRPPGPYTIDLMAEDAAAVLDALDAGPAHVVGASMGGYMGLTLALRYPSLVKSLILIATAVGGRSALGVPDSTLKAWAAAANLPPAEFARQTMPLSFRPGWADEHPNEIAELLARRLELPTPQETWAAQFEACEDFLRVGLPQGNLMQPVLVVHGTQDRVVPYGNAAQIIRRIPQATLLSLEGAGHLCWIECADEVNQAIRSAIAEVEQVEEPE